MAVFNLAGLKTYTLQSSISSTQSTITLTSFKVPISAANVTMALMNTSIVYATIAPRTSQSEFISFTGITQNADGTATLTGVVRGLDRTYPFTTNATFKLPHAGATQFILSDMPQALNEFSIESNDNVFSGNNTFSGVNTFSVTSPTIPTATSSDIHEAASIEYVNNIALAGAPNASTTVKGIVELATQAEVDARTTTGGTGAKLVPTPDTQRSTLLSDYKADTGAANAYVITPVPAITAYTVGQQFSFKATNANTTTSTLNVNGLGVITIKKLAGINLVNGDIMNGMIVQVEYDGTNFIMTNPSGNGSITQYTGTGVDGAYTFSNQGTAPAGTTKTDNTNNATIFRLDRDIYCTNVTIDTTVSVLTNGFRIFATGTVSVTGSIKSNGGLGGNASGKTGGVGGTAAYAQGTLPASFAGTTGGVGGDGGVGGSLAAQSLLGSVGSAGSAGGSGGTNVNAGGTSAASPVTAYRFPNTPSEALSLISGGITLASMYMLTSGSGNGGGGGGSSGAGNFGGGGGGGASGGMIVIYAKTIIVNGGGVISATGGNGGNGGNSGGSTAGGGAGAGGSGGVIILVTSSYTNSGTVSVAGGTAGTAGTGGGLAGNNGLTGIIYQLTV